MLWEPLARQHLAGLDACDSEGEAVIFATDGDYLKSSPQAKSIGSGKPRCRLSTRIRSTSRRLYGLSSKVDLLGNLKGIIDLNAKVSDRALELSVAEQQLAGA